VRFIPCLKNMGFLYPYTPLIVSTKNKKGG
jgi:hypothetical protein